MKLTKTLALTALVAGSLLAGTALQAQDAPKEKPAAGAAGMRGRPNADQIAKELSLTDEQKTKVKAALEEQQTKAKALREDTTLSQEDRRAKTKEIRTATQTKMKEILTPEQYTKWQSSQRTRGPGGAGAKPAAGSDTAPKKD